MSRFAVLTDHFKGHAPRAALAVEREHTRAPRAQARPVDIDLSLVLDQIRKLVPGKLATDVSLSLACGRALPDWLSLSDQRVLTVGDMTVPEITLRLDAVYDDGHVSHFELVIDAKLRPMKVRVKKVDTLSLAQLFSEDLLRDEPLNYIKIPHAA